MLDLSDLKAALVQLNPTGPDGFEGLAAHVLAKVTGLPCRLAGSGSQHGKDGEATSVSRKIAFEAKRYTGAIDDKAVLSKPTQMIGNRNDRPDVWVLWATIGIKTQLLDTLRAATDEMAIACLVLDWPDAATLPPLAAACALALHETESFLIEHLADKALAQKASKALGAIRGHEDFDNVTRDFRQLLQEPMLAAASGLKANRVWLNAMFSDQRMAAQRWGQPLAPFAQMAMPLMERPKLIEKLENTVYDNPDGKIAVIIGGEGCGKSWIFAQSWHSKDDRPLTIIIPSNVLSPSTTHSAIEPYLISRLIEQTGGIDSAFSRKRWERLFRDWRDKKDPVAPRLIVFVDGLNQKASVDWPSWLDGLCAFLDEIGGKLVISTRQGFYEERIETSLVSSKTPILVPEWSRSELSGILNKRSILISELPDRVVRSLQNPRILGIAFNLLEKSEIRTFQELTIGRLLFEHVRVNNNAPERPALFQKRLSKHAQDIIDRVKAQQRDDLSVFEVSDLSGAGPHVLSDDLLAVSEGRFFRTDPNDSTLYTLTDEGLELALGLAIIESLKEAERNRRDTRTTLDEVVEPIAALNKTAQVVLSAVMVAAIDCKSTDIQSALMCAYLRLQNIDQNDYPGFSLAVREAPEAAMDAFFELSVSTRCAANPDWLMSALRDERRDANCWAIMSSKIETWLRYYSLAPEIGQLKTGPGHSVEEVREETQKRREQLNERLDGLSSRERDLLNKKLIRHDDVDSASFSADLFCLMAGKPLAQFSEALVAWNFSQALSSNIRTPHDEFRYLIRFNSHDWEQTRERMLAEAKIFEGSDTSRTGKWTLVEILRATSTEQDAEREERLVEELIAGRPRYRGGRLVETYCETDPCDPESSKPDNIIQTAERYRKIDVAELHKSRGMTSEDHFFRDALPGLSRFDPQSAIEGFRRFVRSIVGRDNRGMELCLYALESNTAIIEQESASRFLEKIEQLIQTVKCGEKGKDQEWLLVEYLALVLFPHLEGNDQVTLLMAVSRLGPLLIKLMAAFSEAGTTELEEVLNEAASSGTADQQVAVLAFARYSETQFSDEIIRTARSLLKSDNTSVRAEVMDIGAWTGDRTTIESVALSGWKAGDLHPRENHYEIWYGSEVIIQAGKLGIVETDEVLDRISPQRFDRAVRILGDAVSEGIADRLDAAISRALKVGLPPAQPPPVEQTLDPENEDKAPLYSLAQTSQKLSADEFFSQLSETNEDFRRRQEDGWKAFNKFDNSLTEERARLIIENIGHRSIEACVRARPDLVRQWAQTILSLDRKKLTRVQNIGLMIAEKLSQIDASLAAKIFERLEGGFGYVNLIYGAAGISLESLSIWRCADSPEIDALRERRLDWAATDDAIATEVFAALECKKHVFLRNYVESRLRDGPPVRAARAIMICGFCDVSDLSDDVLSRFSKAKGLLGHAVNTARYAYERNVWAHHWFEKMCGAKSAEDFWCYSNLFLKVVDARFEFWDVESDGVGEIARRFDESLTSEREKRIKSWRSKREKKLFGLNAPDAVFVRVE